MVKFVVKVLLMVKRHLHKVKSKFSSWLKGIHMKLTQGPVNGLQNGQVYLTTECSTPGQGKKFI